MIDRQALIDEYIDACENCGGFDFPKRRDCDGCVAAADEEIERLEAAQADRFSAITVRAIAPCEKRGFSPMPKRQA